MRKYLVPIFVGSYICCGLCQAKADVLIRGVAEGCFAGKVVNESDVEVYVFDAAKSPRLTVALKEFMQLEPRTRAESIVEAAAAFERYSALEEEILHIVKSSPHLASTRTTSAGAFEAKVNGTAGKTVIFVVVGFRVSDEGPGYIAYAQVHRAPQSRASVVSVTLQFYRGGTWGECRGER